LDRSPQDFVDLDPKKHRRTIFVLSPTDDRNIATEDRWGLDHHLGCADLELGILASTSGRAVFSMAFLQISPRQIAVRRALSLGAGLSPHG
jgi:hypothetical protein